MKILIINNHSTSINKLLDKIKNAKMIDFQKLSKINLDNYDGIILSGGSSFSILNHKEKYLKELKIIKSFKKPILGICLGFELIAFAFKEKLEQNKYKIYGNNTIKILSNDLLLYKIPKDILVFESHKWIIKKTNNLIPLAKSKFGVEIIKHPKKIIYGVQFHPEIKVSRNYSKKILNNFLEIVKYNIK